jgi:uncharacterized protein (TIGR00290 family)
MSKKVLISWSTGKDSAWTLYVLQQDINFDIVGLFCTVNKEFNRVTMHGVRVELLEQQANNAGLPLYIIQVPNPCSYSEYEDAITQFTNKVEKTGIECFAFGDLFLKEVKQYRSNFLKTSGITPIFPLWDIQTKILSRQMIVNGLKAKITCINPKLIPPEFAGRMYDESFLNDIPKNVDPCGENGEFHSFAFDGPMFQRPIKIVSGDTVRRNGLYFTDLLLDASHS